MTGRRIELHIDRLVLHGTQPDDTVAFEAELRTALEQRLGSSDADVALHRGGAMPYLDGGTATATAGAAVGEAIARSILGGGVKR